MDLKKIDKVYLPELANRFFDTMTLQKGISRILLEIPTATLQVIFGLILLSLYHPFFIAFGLFLLLMVGVILYFTGYRGLETSIETSTHKYSVAAWIEELARGVKSFKLSKFSAFHIRKADGFISQYLQSKTSHFKILKFQYWTLIIFKVVITATMLIVGSILLVDQQLNIGQFIAAELVILLVINSIEKIIVSLDKVYDVLTSVKKLGMVIETPLEKEGIQIMEENNKGIKVGVKDLSFSYDDESRKILDGVSFKVEPGEKICLLGDQGSGKTTLMRLLTGTYSSFNGAIHLDDLPINSYSIDSIRSQIGILYSHQEIFLGTVEENITMGNPAVKVSDITALIHELGLEKILDELPVGLQTELEPMGKRLSLNLREQILLLRALIGKPRLLLLHDNYHRFEKSIKDKIVQYIFEKCPQTTLLIITQSPDFIFRCDKVVILKEGIVEEFGAVGEHRSKIEKYLD